MRKILSMKCNAYMVFHWLKSFLHSLLSLPCVILSKSHTDHDKGPARRLKGTFVAKIFFFCV